MQKMSFLRFLRQKISIVELCGTHCLEHKPALEEGVTVKFSGYSLQSPRLLLPHFTWFRAL
jgi:hypothetical protein